MSTNGSTELPILIMGPDNVLTFSVGDVKVNFNNLLIFRNNADGSGYKSVVRGVDLFDGLEDSGVVG